MLNKKRGREKKRSTLLMAFGVASVMPFNAFSAEVQVQSKPELETMIVTAQKVEENIQEVPIAVTVLDEFAIEDREIKTVNDIGQYIPNFYTFSAGNGGIASPSIRGIYSDMTTTTSSVSMYIDGVPMLNAIGFDAVLNNIERIEVLRGPQGTLYGKNAYAGVINVLTKKPDNKMQAKVGLELGNDNKREYSLSASAPIIDNLLYFGVSGKHYEKDGSMANTYLNSDFNERENNYGQLQLRYTPTDDLEIVLISSKSKNDNGGFSANMSSSDNIYEVQNDGKDFNKLAVTTHALSISYDFGQYNLFSVTSYKQDEDLRFGDYDYSPIEYYHSLIDTTYKTLNQELKLTAETESLTWLLGLSADKTESDAENTVMSIDPNMVAQSSQYTEDMHSIGIFAHADYKITEKLSLLGGIRYDRDEKEKTNNTTGKEYELSYHAVSPKIALNYAIDDNMMTYISATKGYKSGGFYIFSPEGKETYDKETLWNYELGFKSTLLNNRLIFNSAIYYIDVSDMQVLTSVNLYQGYISNAASATSKGFELEATYNATNNITLFSAFGYNKTTYGAFSDANGDYKGNHGVYTPEYNYSLGTQYRNDLGVYVRVDLTGYGEMYTDKANEYKQDAYSLVHSKIGYETEDYDLYLYGKNIFDKDHHVDTADGVTYLSEPREFGVKVNYRW